MVGGGANAAKTLRGTLNQGPLHDPTPWYVDTGPRRDPDKPVDLRAVFDAFCALYRQTHMSNMTFWRLSKAPPTVGEEARTLPPAYDSQPRPRDASA